MGAIHFTPENCYDDAYNGNTGGNENGKNMSVQNKKCMFKHDSV